ncbi:MAG TPA: hypothetical protein VF800_12535 [Telluria sp.]
MLTIGMLGLFAMATWPPLTERSYGVAVTSTCTGRRCSACTYRADILLRFDYTDTTICVDEVQPTLRIGEQIIVRGYFHPLMIHIDSVRRASAAPPVPTPTSAP